MKAFIRSCVRVTYLIDHESIGRSPILKAVACRGKLTFPPFSDERKSQISTINGYRRNLIEGYLKTECIRYSKDSALSRSYKKGKGVYFEILVLKSQ